MTKTPKLFLAGYLFLSLATLAAMIVLRNHPSIVNAAVWIRGSIVVASALVTNILAARGDVRRVRIIAIVMTIAIVVIVAVPGPFPVVFKIEQAVCALLLIGAILTLPRKLRSRESA